MIIFAVILSNITIDVKQQLAPWLNVLEGQINAIVDPVLNGDDCRTTYLHIYWLLL